jgi:hypothetical protein
MERHKVGVRIRVTNPAGTLIGVIVMGLIAGFVIGYIATSVVPGLANLTASLTCGNGTLMAQKNTTSSQPGSVSVHFSADCSENGNHQDVTSRVLMTNEAIFAVLTPILLVMICMLLGVF